MGSCIVLVCSRTSQRVKALRDINKMFYIVCMPVEQLKWQNLCRDVIGEWRMCFLRTYIVCICSWTSQRPKALQDISNMLQIGCMPTEQLERLQLCTNAMDHNRGVLYDSFIDQLHLYKGIAHAASLQAYIQYAAYYLQYILQSFGVSAGLRAYSHYIIPHIVHLSLTHCMSAKVSLSSTL